MASLFDRKAAKIAKGIEETLNRFEPTDPTKVDQSLFVEAPVNDRSYELGGYSNYSYWRSTFRAFLRSPLSIVFLSVLVTMLLFTFVQPLLPDQKSATYIYSYDDSNKLIRNKGPHFDNVIAKLVVGDTLPVVAVGKTWATVENVALKLARNERLEPLEKGEKYTRVRTMTGVEGWVQTNYLRYDITEVKDGIPAEWPRVFMNTNLTLYLSQEVYVATKDIEVADAPSGQTTVTATIVKDTQLRTEPTSLAFWFGTNAVGQDLWARIWTGTRTSLFIGVSVGLISALIGIILGAIWGYVRGLDKVFTEIYNVWENIPYTVVRILITYIMRPSLSTIIFVMCITGWLGMARFVRNQIVIIRDREYNLASRCLGTGTARMIVKNLLPYLVSVIMLRTALAIPEAIGTEVFLTYIGLGLPVSIPSLGNLINEGRLLMTDPALSYQLIFPAAIVSIITISFYALGNAFSDAADPRNHV